MRNKSTINTTPTLPSNVVAFMTAPSAPVDPVQEIAFLYNVDQYYATDIYETVGDEYTNERMVAALCGILPKKGGVSC